MGLLDRLQVLCRYQVGVSLRLRLPGGAVLRWRASLHGVDARGNLWMQLCDVPGVTPLIPPGTEVSAVFRDPDQGLAGRFTTITMAPLQEHEEGPLLHVRLPTKIEDVNLRQFCRVRVLDDEHVHAQLATPLAPSRPPVAVTLVDVSAGGAQVHVPGDALLPQLGVGSRVRMYFAGTAVADLAREHRTSDAIVRRVRSAPGGRALGVEFQDPPEMLRRSIVRYVFSHQREALNARLHAV